MFLIRTEVLEHNERAKFSDRCWLDALAKALTCFYVLTCYLQCGVPTGRDTCRTPGFAPVNAGVLLAFILHHPVTNEM